jgi:hypothetical protein
MPVPNPVETPAEQQPQEPAPQALVPVSSPPDQLAQMPRQELEHLAED